MVDVAGRPRDSVFSIMAMFITQDTFDEVVKENMEEFGMDRKSAAEDAVGQFKAQGEKCFTTLSRLQDFCCFIPVCPVLPR